jgi:hypothetical protein
MMTARSNRQRAGPRTTPAVFGLSRHRASGNTIMFKAIIIALLATTLFAGPVLAQSTLSGTRALATQPVKTVKIVKVAKPAKVKTVKVIKVKKHKVHKTKITKPGKHANHFRHAPAGKRIFHVTTKHTMPSHNN